MRLSNKQFTLIIILILSIAMIVTLAFIFRVNTVELNFLVASTRYSDEQSVKEIINDCQIKKGNSVFLLKKEAAIEQLEVDYPYLDVINIEVIFPNSVRIHSVERIECYALKLTNNSYAICDKDLKVLRFSNTPEDMVLIKDGFNTAQIGEYISYENSNFYTELIKEFEKMNQNSTSVKFLLKDIELKTVYGDEGNEYNFKILTDCGISIEIQNISTSFSDKIYNAYTLYSQKINENFSSGLITVGNYSDGRVFSAYME